MKKLTKERIKISLIIIGFIGGFIIAFELLRMFMWFCYYAGIPM